MIKLFELLTRRSDMTPEQSMNYWTGTHAPLVKRNAEPLGFMVQYINNVGQIEEYEPDALPFDGVVEGRLEVAIEQFAQMITVPGYEVVMDEPNFLGQRPIVLIVEEKVRHAPVGLPASKSLLFLRRHARLTAPEFEQRLETEFAPAFESAWGESLVGLSLNFVRPVAWQAWGPELGLYDAVVEAWFNVAADRLGEEQASRATTLSAALDPLAARRHHLRVREVIQYDLTGRLANN